MEYLLEDEKLANFGQTIDSSKTPEHNPREGSVAASILMKDFKLKDTNTRLNQAESTIKAALKESTSLNKSRLSPPLPILNYLRNRAMMMDNDENSRSSTTSRTSMDINEAAIIKIKMEELAKSNVNNISTPSHPTLIPFTKKKNQLTQLGLLMVGDITQKGGKTRESRGGFNFNNTTSESEDTSKSSTQYNVDDLKRKISASKNKNSIGNEGKLEKTNICTPYNRKVSESKTPTGVGTLYSLLQKDSKYKESKANQDETNIGNKVMLGGVGIKTGIDIGQNDIGIKSRSSLKTSQIATKDLLFNKTAPNKSITSGTKDIDILRTITGNESSTNDKDPKTIPKK